MPASNEFRLNEKVELARDGEVVAIGHVAVVEKDVITVAPAQGPDKRAHVGLLRFRRRECRFKGNTLKTIFDLEKAL